MSDELLPLHQAVNDAFKAEQAAGERWIETGEGWEEYKASTEAYYAADRALCSAIAKRNGVIS